MGRPGNKRDRMLTDDALSSAADALDGAGFGAAMRAGLSPERSYAASISPRHRRRHAQFFTPPKIANLMAEWVLGNQASNLLDPALGMGALVRAALARNPYLKVTAFEKDSVILGAYHTSQPIEPNITLFCDDFLTSPITSKFDAILMNPPYLRHHDMNYDFDIYAAFSRMSGVTISKLSNAYLLFTVKAVLSLMPGGRAAIIVPTEWMNANFGTAMKHFLLRENILKHVIYFSNCSEIFEDALTTASILLVEQINT